MAVYRTKFIDIAVEAGAYSSGDALGEKNSFPSVPEKGVIMGIVAQDHAKQEVNFDIVMFLKDIAGTTDNAAFDPTDAELAECLGAVSVSTWFSFNDNSVGTVDNVGLPYWAPSGNIYFQCVTRGTPTYAAITDVQVSLTIVA